MAEPPDRAALHRPEAPAERGPGAGGIRMRAGWLVAIAAGTAIGMAPADVTAQSSSNRARQQQELQRQRQEAREQDRRSAERERLRRQQQTRPRGIVTRRDDRYDYDRNRRDDRYDYERDRRNRDNRDVWDVFESRNDRRNDRYDRNGPAFCRNGQGHPVRGRQWCRDKGFGLGRDNARDIWGDIIFRDRRYDNRQLSRSTLGDILGSVVLGRFDSYGRSYYGSGSLNGRWLDSRASVLQLYMGSTPIARLLDTNRDGRVDSVSLTR